MAANVDQGQVRYVAQVPPSEIVLDDNDREIIRWIKNELDRIAQAIAALEHQYQIRNAPPERYGVGFVAYADGTNWNPGAGEGLYVYKSTGWAKMA